MRRVISLWLPNLATDRWRRRNGGPPEATPLVLFAQDSNRQVLRSADAAAVALGLYPGMKLAQARAMVPGLAVQPADPAADAEALRRLAGWCLRYAPLVSADPPDGVWIDATGCAHLYDTGHHGRHAAGEAALLRDLVGRLTAQGIAARAAIADTPGAAHATARFAEPAVTGSGRQDVACPSEGGQRGMAVARDRGPVVMVPPDAQRAVLSRLPVTALRLPPETLAGLRVLGFERIGQLAAAPRAPLVRRFGALLATRLDQAFGTVFEPIVPMVPPEMAQARLAFAEPLLAADALAAAIERLTALVCGRLEKAGQGARRLDLLFVRVDGSVQAIRIGAARPTRHSGHLARMLREQLERVDPGLGVEAMQLSVPHVEALAYAQAAAPLDGASAGPPDLAALVDRLANRLGAERIWRAEPTESDVPERAVRRVPPLAPEAAGAAARDDGGRLWMRGKPAIGSGIFDARQVAPTVATERSRARRDASHEPPSGSCGVSPPSDLVSCGLSLQASQKTKSPFRLVLADAASDRLSPEAPLPGAEAAGVPVSRAARAEPAAGATSSSPVRLASAAPPLTRDIRPARLFWPASWPRPIRLLDPPQPIEAMALLPDHPPVAFTWRRIRHRIRHADGPERIAGEWWKRDGELRGVRDYFRVEDEEGHRFWLFRRGDGADCVTGDMRWFLHGFF